MPLDLGNMNLEERAKYLALKVKYAKKLLPWYKKWWGIIILIILGLFIVLSTAAGIYIFEQIKTINQENSYSDQINSSQKLKQAIYGLGTNYFMGTEGAVVTIVEFSDFACPYCRQAHQVIKKIVDRYPGKVKIIYRDLPLHENSIDLSMAARCAGEQGFFWEMHDQLFANQDALSGTGEELKSVVYSLAGTLGLNAARFDNCYQAKKYLTNISADLADANTLKVKGTPTWFINERSLSGYIPDDNFLAILDAYFNSLK